VGLVSELEGIPSFHKNEQRAAYAQPMAFEEIMTVAGGIYDEPVGGHGEVMRAEKKRKKSRMSHITSSFCYLICWASHFMGPLFLCNPIPAKKAGLTVTVPSRRERERRGGGGGGGREERMEWKLIRCHMW